MYLADVLSSKDVARGARIIIDECGKKREGTVRGTNFAYGDPSFRVDIRRI